MDLIVKTCRKSSFANDERWIAYIAPSHHHDDSESMRQQHKYNDDIEANKTSKTPKIWTLICPFSLQTNNTNTIRKAKTSPTKNQNDSKKLT